MGDRQSKRARENRLHRRASERTRSLEKLSRDGRPTTSYSTLSCFFFFSLEKKPFPSRRTELSWLVLWPVLCNAKESVKAKSVDSKGLQVRSEGKNERQQVIL